MATKITLQETKLFEEWKQSDGSKNFVRDGVVDEEVFLKQQCRFVFILKEPDQMGETPLPVFLRDGAPKNGGHTWNPVCKWLTGQNRVFSPAERAAILKKIAVVNLKKEDGGSRTDMKLLNQVVKRDRVFIKRQLDIYSEVTPVVFVCCGSGNDGILSILNKHIFGNIDLHRNAPLPYAKPDNREVYYVAFKHPNCRKSSEIMIKEFKKILAMFSISL